MPAPNDLTPEEEQEFVNHGVQPAGPGSEPVIENVGDVQQRTEEEGAEQHGDRGSPIERRPNGQFASKEEREAAAAQGQQQGQQQTEGEGGEGAQQEPKFVPLEALHAERARVRQMAQQMQTLQTRTNMLLQGWQGQQPSAEQMPDLNEDPAGYIQALAERLERFEQIQSQERETQQIDTSLNNDEAVFAMQQPDYHKASDYYVQSRANELLRFYPPEQAQQMLLREAREIARQSWARGLSAAETIYGLATARGYNPNVPDRESGGGQQQQRGPTAKAVVDGVNKGKQASRSLSGGAGGGRAAELNAEALLNMSDEEFEEHLKLGSKGADARFAAIG